MKSRDLPTDKEISQAFGGFNFGDGSRSDDAKARTLAKGLLDSVSGYSCGSTLREILVRLGLAKYQKGSLHITITAYGYRCVLSAHKRLMQPPPQENTERLRRALASVCEIAHCLQVSELTEYQTNYANYIDIPGSRWQVERDAMLEDLRIIEKAMELLPPSN